MTLFYSIFYKYCLVKLIFFGLPYLGISYSKGHWTTNNLYKLLQLGINNKKALRSILFLNFPFKFYHWVLNTFTHNSFKKSKKQISYHYDLGNNFYRLWLDKSMTYSSAIFNKYKSLNQAQNNKYKQIVTAANIKNNHSILEIGCGWGGFMRYVESNIGSKIFGITLSKEQYNFIKNQSLKNSSVFYKDYRNVKQKFDRIVSIEMFEAVGKKNWNTYFKKLRECLNDKGKVVLQIITISEENYNYYVNRKDFIQQYVFPGGMLPTKTSLKKLAINNGLIFKEYSSFGKDYAKTLLIWRKNFLANWHKIEKLGFDDKFKRLWEYYLTYCEVGFKSEAINVGQFLLEKNKKLYE